MKKTLLTIVLMSVIKCFGQQGPALPVPDTAISYSGVALVNGIPKEELYIRARDWMNSNLQGLQIQDKQTGEVSAKGVAESTIKFRFFGTHTANAVFNFTANIWVKDGRYMYTITNISNTTITYENSTATARDDQSSAVGMLYTSKECKVNVLGLTKTRSNEAYQSAKDGFDALEKEMTASLQAGMEKPSTPDF